MTKIVKMNLALGLEDDTSVTFEDIDSDIILRNAMGRLKDVIIIGLDDDDNLHVAMAEADIRHVIYNIEWAKHLLMADEHDLEEDDDE